MESCHVPLICCGSNWSRYADIPNGYSGVEAMKWWGWIPLCAFFVGMWLYGDRLQAWEEKHVLDVVWVLLFVAYYVGIYFFGKLSVRIDELNDRVSSLQQEADALRGN